MGPGHPRVDIILQNHTVIGKEGSRTVTHFRPSPPYEEFDLASSLGQLFPKKDAAREAAAKAAEAALKAAMAAAAAGGKGAKPPAKDGKKGKEGEAPKKKVAVAVSLLPAKYGVVA